MVDVSEIGWGSYASWEGPLWWGRDTPFVLPTDPTENDRVMAIISSTEGGSFSAVNMYDRMIVSVGLIQFGEAGIYAVSDMLGAVVRRDPDLLKPLEPAMAQSGFTFHPNNKNRYRFFFPNGCEVDTLAEQQRLFLENSNGLKGQWDEPSKLYARTWAACMANVFQQPEAQAVQRDFTASRLMGFVTQEARATLWGPTDPPGFPAGWVGALRAAYLSFAANLPAVASKQLGIALSLTTGSKWSEEWCIDILRNLTFGPQIAIYPHRYESIRPVVESLFGVDLPDFAANLNTWHRINNIDPKPDEWAAPTFTTTKEVQTELLSEGYDLGPAGADGVMGAKTVAAIRTFQGLHGILADGIVGPQTRRALVAECEKRG